MEEKRFILEYIWIDAFNRLRSKSRVINLIKETGAELCVEDIPEWTYDGSSTGQATGFNSDVILKPCSLFNDPFRQSNKNQKCYLVLCETYDNHGSPHATNNRSHCRRVLSQTKVINNELWYGLEQEYVIYDRLTMLPYKWKSLSDPGCGPQGPYYCSCGGDRAFGREIVEEHMQCCIEAGLKFGGINAEVMPSQWEFQIGPLDGLAASDQLWIARYILDRVSEKYGCWINLHPKPILGDWNGSGCHTNVSTKTMRMDGGYGEIISACQKLEKCHQEHLKVYGDHNELRLTGHHETASMTKFSYGDAHRGCSIRIPLGVVKDNKGYLEDRRPASNIDPYLVTAKLAETLCL